MRCYIINSFRVVNADTCREAEALAASRGIPVRHVRVLDDHNDQEQADIIARLAKALLNDRDFHPSLDERDFFEGGYRQALTKKLSPEQRTTIMHVRDGAHPRGDDTDGDGRGRLPADPKTVRRATPTKTDDEKK